MDFGELLNGDAAGLVQAVRQSRLARMAGKVADAGAVMTGEGVRVPTFGEMAEERRTAAAAAPEGPTAAPPQAAARAAGAYPEDIAGQIAFLVDVVTGYFKPVLPGEPTPEPGPREMLMKVGAQGEPNILAQGKRVRPQDIARLQDPKRGVQPRLAPDYQVPPQYEGLAKALGVEMGEGEGPDAEAAAGSPAPETMMPDEGASRRRR